MDPGPTRGQHLRDLQSHAFSLGKAQLGEIFTACVSKGAKHNI
jgi:hypothetical protein